MNVLITLIACGWNPATEGLGQVQPMLGIESEDPSAEQLAEAPPREIVNAAVAALEPMEGASAHGLIRFEETDDGLVARASIRGLQPGSVHGVHVHEGSSCGPDGEAAGSHFAPNLHPHGSPADWASHAGDLGNVTADADGVAELDVTRGDLSFDGDESVLVRTVVVHAKRDTFDGDAGKAGVRIACGTIVTSQ